jgi:hypothetical protein
MTTNGNTQRTWKEIAGEIVAEKNSARVIELSRELIKALDDQVGTDLSCPTAVIGEKRSEEQVV